MLLNHIAVKNRHHKFIKTVCETGIVYGLKNRKGFATSRSIHYDDANGEPVGLICFWSEKVRAKSCKKDGWRKHKLTEIPLPEFMENWCVGMARDGLLVGTQFDQNMFGFEAKPLELILDLVTELKLLGKNLNFRKFNGIEGIEKQVRSESE